MSHSPLLSSSWYRVASLKPKLRSHFEVHRQPLGKELSFLLQDHALGKFYRFNVNAYDILGRLDGELTVHDIWEASIACYGDDAPTQDETIALLGRLHAVDALHVNVTPDCLELFQRSRRSKKNWWKNALRSPLVVRVPLLDPDRALAAVLPIVGTVFSPTGFMLWAAIVTWAAFLAVTHWPELSHGGVDRLLEPGNLLALLLVYPVMKMFHELGHAIAVRKWGGEVHEIGITLLVFIPVPYVDASAATAIASKYRRIVVSAAGMMVELFLAAIALLVWINIEPGLLRLVAFNVMLIGGVSTLLFNGNPLLRFDAYYILKDVIEIPNLASRSSRYLGFLAQRYLFGVQAAESPVTRSRERGWLLCYGIAATLFRVLMSFTIVLFIAGQYFVVGILLALWALTLLVILPIVKCTNFVLFSQTLAQNRSRALGVSASLVGFICAFIFFAPVPSATLAQGVLWLPEQAKVQAGTDGVVTELLAKPSSRVLAGQPLLALSDPFLGARVDLLEAELAELHTRQRIESLTDPVSAAVISDQITSKQAELDRERERASKLVIHSNNNGLFILRQANDLPGRFVSKGEQIGLVLDRASMTVRVAVPQNRIGLVRETLQGVQVKLAESLQYSFPATLTRRVPAAHKRLPSQVLGSQGGGSIAVDPSDKEGLTALQSVFLLDVTLNAEPESWRIGQRAYVKFDHGNQPLAQQWYRLGRQLFIRRFGV